ncbi:MAG: tetratricopeptide repeat protein [Geobacteraceae bacterium]|nr:tetratricopeptide repeat protein [Geobacteraceae bacterium]
MSSPGSILRIALSVSLLLLAACYSAPKARPPVLLQEAQRHNLAGIEAEEKGRTASAEAQFTEAYRIFASVENHSGMIMVLINRSRLYRSQGDLEKAALSLKEAEALMPRAPELESEVYFESGRLFVLKGDSDAALKMAQKAVTSAAEPDKGRMNNLLAGIWLKKGDSKKGRENAETALKAAKSSGSRREEANALRLIGEAAFIEKSYGESIRHYEAALLIDREIAVAPRVVTDLIALSRAAEADGETGAAADYLQRAVDAAIAGKMSAQVASHLERMAELYRRSNRGNLAEKTIELKNTLQQKRSE